MIPSFSPCSEAAVAACPGLFNDLDSLRGVAMAAVQEAIGDTPCGQSLTSAVVLNPTHVGPGNHVLVIPGAITAKRRARSNATQFQMVQRTVTAVVAVILEGYPIIEMEGDHALLPRDEEYHEASRFVVSVGWCVYCAMVEALNAGNLLQNADQFSDVSISEGEFSDAGGGQANATFRVNWVL